MKYFRFIWILVICLILANIPATSLGEEKQVDASAIQPFLDIIVDAADAREIDAMSMGQADAASLTYGIMYRLIYRGIIPATVSDEGIALMDQDALQVLYNQLFAAGEFVLPEEDCCDMIKRFDQGLSFDVSTASGGIAGAHIILAQEQEQTGRLRVVAELYRSQEDYYTFAPEDLDSTEWFGVAEFQLQQDEQSMFGYTLVSYGKYVDSDTMEHSLLDYADEAMGFFIQYPNAFEGQLQTTDNGVTATLPDGSASFSAQKIAGGAFSYSIIPTASRCPP